jgi:hypothetical protein
LADLETSITEKEPPPEEGVSPTVREWTWVLFLTAALFVFDLLTYNLYPAVWCDEVLFSEPAINFVQHGSFTTTVWEFQPGNTFPVVNCPLYSLALVPWLSITGTSLLAVRSFNHAFFAMATVLLWMVSWRFKLVNNASARILMVNLFHFGYGMSYSFRCSRPDILGLNCLLILLLSFKVERGFLKYAFLLICSAVTVWIGLQVALYACLACAAAWVLFRRPLLRELVLIAGGIVAGASSLFMFLKVKGVLSYFLPVVVGMMGRHYAHSPHTTVGVALLKTVRQTLTSYLADFTTVLLGVGLIVTIWVARGRFRYRSVSVMRFCLFMVISVPAVFNIVGHYAFYYSYMLYVPAILALFTAYSELPIILEAKFQRQVKWFILAIMIAGTLVGLPLRLAITTVTCRLTSRTEIQRLIDGCVTSKDVVFSDYAPFFEVKHAANVVYAPYYSSALVATHIAGHDFTPEEKQSISVLVIRPEQSDYLTNFFGGRWNPVTEPFGDVQDFRQLTKLPLIGWRLAHYATQPQTERYQVQVFRRLLDPPAR